MKKLVSIVESLLSGIEELMRVVFYSDPAVVAAKIIDTDGMELLKLLKQRYKSRQDKMGPLMNAIMKYCDRFLKFLKRSPNDAQPFLLSWYFENIVVFAAYSSYGTIVVYAEPDVNEGYLKVLLSRAILNYGALMRPVFEA